MQIRPRTYSEIQRKEIATIKHTKHAYTRAQRKLQHSIGGNANVCAPKPHHIYTHERTHTAHNTYHSCLLLRLGYSLQKHHNLLFFTRKSIQLLFNELFNSLIALHVVLRHQTHSSARSLCACCASHSVYVVFGVCGYVIVDYDIH